LQRAKGRAYVARCNEIATAYDDKTIYQALELSERAHELHQLPYTAGLSSLEQFPPGRFEWICDETEHRTSIKLRDRLSGTVADWPDWFGS
jgi:hypothetical protein